MSIEELAGRANIHHAKYEGKHVFVYEDHRYLLNILFAFKTMNPGFMPHNIIYFDRHDDAAGPSQATMEKLKRFRRKAPSLRRFWDLTEFDLSTLDNDWLLAAMEMKLIRDAVLIGAEETGYTDALDGVYIDQGKKKHQLYQLPHIWDALAEKGALAKEKIDERTDAIRDILGFGLTGDHDIDPYGFTYQSYQPYVLDFDLDVFAGNGPDGPIKAWSERTMRSRFDQVSNSYQLSSRTFVKRLIERACFITICKESPYCGGFKESSKIFGQLDDLLFDGKLSK